MQFYDFSKDFLGLPKTSEDFLRGSYEDMKFIGSLRKSSEVLGRPRKSQ